MTIRIKHSLDGFIGKIVSGFVMAEYTDGNPINRIFVIFSDGTSLETWQDDGLLYMSEAPGFGSVDKAVEILERRQGGKIQAFRARHEDPNDPQGDFIG